MLRFRRTSRQEEDASLVALFDAVSAEPLKPGDEVGGGPIATHSQDSTSSFDASVLRGSSTTTSSRAG